MDNIDSIVDIVSIVEEGADKDEDAEKMIEKLFENSGHLCLWRLIESNHFTPTMALSYVFTIRQPEINEFIIKKLFSFSLHEIKFFLMQLVHMYLFAPQSNELIFQSINFKSAQDLTFSLLVTWLLESYLLGTSPVDTACLAALNKLLNSIVYSWCGDPITQKFNAFISERSFVAELILVARRLRAVSSHSSRLLCLHTELLAIDRSLSAPVFIPMISLPQHIVVRIPYKESSILNSKDKAPYLVYVEVIETNNTNVDLSNLNLFRKEEFKKYVHKMHHSELIFSPRVDSSPCFNDQMSIDNVSNHRNVDEKPQTKYCAADIRKEIEVASETNSLNSSSPSQPDPSSPLLAERWKDKIKRIRSNSPYGYVPGWNLYSIIVKHGDDLRQDYLAYQFLKKCNEIWKLENLHLWVRPYCVVITESCAGIIEAISNAVSIHQIKSRMGCTLEEYFRKQYIFNSEAYTKAKKEFIRSLAGYSLFQYIFQVKDRHNGNILLDEEGHIIHIDFGYILCQSPKNISFETSPFKMSYDFIELLEGTKSDFFLYFKSLMLLGFIALRKHMKQLMVLVEMMKIGNTLACIGKQGQSVESLRARFFIDYNDQQIEAHIDKIIYQSVTSFTTFIYDKFQYYTNGILI